MRTFFLLLSKSKEEKGKRARERESVRERERGRYINVRDKYRLVAFFYAPQIRIEPTASVCALTGNRTHDPLAYGTMFQLTEPHRSGCPLIYF